MLSRDTAKKIMERLDTLEADLRRIEHSIFSVRDAIGKAYGLYAGYYPDKKAPPGVPNEA